MRLVRDTIKDSVLLTLCACCEHNDLAWRVIHHFFDWDHVAHVHQVELLHKLEVRFHAAAVYNDLLVVFVGCHDHLDDTFDV